VRPPLDPLLRPNAITIIGASSRPGSLGHRLITQVRSWRYPGRLYAVNPRYQEIDGVACYPSAAALPEKVDLACFAVSDQRIEAAFAEAAQARIAAAAIFGRLYDTADPPLPQRLGKMARHAGMAVLGGNCMGFINFIDGLKVSGNPPALPDRPGGITIISHSGSTWSGLTGNQRQLDMNFAISAGQEIATTMADYMRFALDRPETRAIGLVIETVRDPEGFVDAFAAADRRGVPVVALKLGRSEHGRRFAFAHSGALSGATAAYAALFERHNVALVDTLDEFTDTLEMMASPRRPYPGQNGIGGLGAVTDSGGERQLIVDLAADVGCPIAALSSGTQDKLTAILDPGMSPENPVDSYGDGRTLLAPCLEAIAADNDVGVVALATNLVHGRAYLKVATEAVEQVHAATAKPTIVLANLHSTVSREAALQLRDHGIPVLMGTRTGLVATRHFLSWHQRRARPSAETVSGAPAALVTKWRDRLAAAEGPVLDARHGLELFADFGGSIPADAIAADERAAVDAAARIGYPVVLKTANRTVLHKTEMGAIALGLGDGEAVVAAYRRIAATCGPLVHVQAQARDGVEMILGLVNDPQLGPMVTIGTGGIFVEILKDAITFVPPVGIAAAKAMLPRLKGYGLLLGARGKPPVDLEALARAIAQFSVLAVALGTAISEMDINPLIAGAWGTTAVDALVVPASTREIRSSARS